MLCKTANLSSTSSVNLQLKFIHVSYPQTVFNFRNRIRIVRIKECRNNDKRLSILLKGCVLQERAWPSRMFISVSQSAAWRIFGSGRGVAAFVTAGSQSFPVSGSTPFWIYLLLSLSMCSFPKQKRFNFHITIKGAEMMKRKLRRTKKKKLHENCTSF